MSISTDVYTNGAAKVREVTEQSVESWRQGVKLFTDQGDRLYRSRQGVTDPGDVAGRITQPITGSVRRP